MDAAASRLPHLKSEVSLLGESKRVIDLNAEIADRALELGMTKQQLAGAQVSRPLVDERDLCSPQAVSAIQRSVEAN
jgi:hypothetical protein